MKYLGLVLVGMIACFVVCCIVTITFVVGILNTEVNLKNFVLAQEKVQSACYDKLWKKIEQETQITVASTKTQKELVNALVSGRQASFIKMITESNPTTIFNQEQFNRLSNTVASERDGLFREQKMLISKVQSYNNFRESAISGIVLNLAGRQAIPEPKLILSDKTDTATETGKDNQTKLGL